MQGRHFAGSSRVALPAALALALLLSGGLQAQVPAAHAQAPAEVQEALRAIEGAALRAHVHFLADDLLEGRRPGTPGYDIAARYMAAHFEALGLEPAGDDGSFFQMVPLRQITPDVARSVLRLDFNHQRRELEHAVDYLMPGDALWPDTGLEGEIVFVGFGISAPEFGHDDYAGVDAKDKIVAFLTGAPPRFPPTQRAHYSSLREKWRLAAAHGAAGVLAIVSPETERNFPWERRALGAHRASMRWLDAQGRPNDVFPEIRAGATLSRAGWEKLFEIEGRSVDEAWKAAQEGKRVSFTMRTRAVMRSVSRHERIASANVAALLRGSDPALRDQVIVYSAHLDHMGRGEPVNDDPIYNGALDNAAGSAALLEIARAFARLPEAPRRSILFLAVTAEEEGLLGSDYFAQMPTVPRRSLVANINLDMPLILYPLGDVVAHGAEHSSLGPVAEAAAAQLGLKVSPDPAPEQVLFIRSDQYSFVRQGVPALFITIGEQSSDPEVDGAAAIEEWLRTRYHLPADRPDQPLDWEAGAQYTRLNFLIGYHVAQEQEPPRWNPGDFFGERFGGGASGSSPQ